MSHMSHDICAWEETRECKETFWRNTWYMYQVFREKYLPKHDISLCDSCTYVMWLWAETRECKEKNQKKKKARKKTKKKRMQGKKPKKGKKPAQQSTENTASKTAAALAHESRSQLCCFPVWIHQKKIQIKQPQREGMSNDHNCAVLLCEFNKK